MAPILSDTATAIHSLTGRSPALDRLAEVVAADLIFVLLLPTVVLWLHEDGLRASVAIVLGAGMALAIGSLIGAWWFEPRPFVVDHFTPLVQHIADAGFPSDHLLLLGAVIGACWMAARRLAVAVGVLGLLVGTARVYVGVHWPEDVVAGFVIGVAAGAGVWALLVPVIPLEGEVVGQPGPVAGFLHARERPGVDAAAAFVLGDRVQVAVAQPEGGDAFPVAQLPAVVADRRTVVSTGAVVRSTMVANMPPAPMAPSCLLSPTSSSFAPAVRTAVRIASISRVVTMLASSTITNCPGCRVHAGSGR
jgi:undecaprenyl-diphosphatase